MQRFLPYIVVLVLLAALAVIVVPIFQAPPMFTTHLGLDLQGGLRGEYQVIATNQQQVTPEILAQTRTIIENRVNSKGVTEPIVQTQGNDRVTVELPGVADPEDLRKLIGTTGRLDFIGVPDAYANQVIGGQPLPTALQNVPLCTSATAEGCILFSGDQIASAAPGQDNTGQPAVNLNLKSDGSAKFDQYAAAHYQKQFAIVLDGIVQSAPTLQATHFGGTAQITGNFTAAEMNDLVTVLKFGSLPLEIKEVGFTQLSPTLGQSFLSQTIFAGLLGIALVFIFMLWFYRLPGAVACVALVYYAIVVYALFRFIPVTLTLAGIAGFVLSVGMAVDANILIFERTKEELRAGKILNAAVEAGFNRAWNSIFDSNVSTLITASILFYFGSSTIRGFALVLIIGVLTSMFTAISLSRMMLRWVVRQSWARKAHLFGVREDEFLLAPTRVRTREAGARV